MLSSRFLSSLVFWQDDASEISDFDSLIVSLLTTSINVASFTVDKSITDANNCCLTAHGRRLQEVIFSRQSEN